MVSFASFLFILANCLITTDSTAIINRNNFISKIDSIQNTPNLVNGYLAVSIVNCKTGEKVIQYNVAKSMKPASTLKLITTASAFGILGENFRYKTYLEHSGTIKNDTLFGNVYIRGTGDPTLGSWRFDANNNYENLMKKWALALKYRSIKVIKGKILADAGYFGENTIPDSWQWGDMGNYYGAGAYGLNINENLFSIYFNTDKSPNTLAMVEAIKPKMPLDKIISYVIADSGTNGDKVMIYTDPFTDKLMANGKLPANRKAFKVKGAIPNPPKTCAEMLQAEVVNQGINILNNDIKNLNENKINLDTVISPTLFEICKNTNFESINLYAEALLKSISTINKEIGNTEKGIEILTDYWGNKNVDLKGFTLKDGSGLSASDYITANNMTSVLSTAYKEPFFNQFYNAIALLGQDGTVKNIAKKSKIAGKIRVKTGTIEKVKSFAGYFNNKKGEMMCFSIMANQFESSESAMSRILAKIFEMMYEIK